MAMVLCLAPLCFGQVIVVKLLNGADGSPVADKLVKVRLHYPKSVPADYVEPLVVQHTGSDGEMRFFIPPDVKPQWLGIRVEFDERGFSCACRVETEPETVLRKGLVVDRRIGNIKTSVPIEAQPAQVIFIARPRSFLGRVLFEY